MTEEGVPFGRYRLFEVLGAGGMGQVFRAYDTETRRVVAVKVLPPQMATDPVFQQRFRREAFAAAQLSEPHVVPIHNFGEIDQQLYVEMRLVEGRDLASIMRGGGQLDPARAVGIIEQVASALEAAHQVGLVHRDVKPSNILLGAGDFACLIDFGIARGVEDTGLTGAGETIGTLAYMAPERLSSGQVDPRSDVYSLACVLFECLTGRQPFPGTSPEHKIAGHLSAPPPRPSEFVPGLSRSWDSVIAAGMAKDPAERYQRTMDLAGAARRALDNTLPGINAATPQPVPVVASLPQPAAPLAAPEQWPVGPGWTPAPHGPPGPAWHGNRGPSQFIGSPPTQLSRSRRAWWRRRALLISAAVAVVLVVAGTVVTVVATSRKPPAPIPSGSTSSSLHADADSPYGEPVTIPLAEGPATGIAVDTKQNLYIAELVQVVQLPAGATTATPLPIAPGLQAFQGDVACAIAVDRAGQVYITGVGDTVARLATPTSPQTILPFTGLKITFGVAVNTSGDVYVADHGRVAILRAATNAQEAVPFHNLSPRGIAVDTAGNIYLYQESVSSAGVVVKLTAGSSKQEALPFQHLESPAGIAVDTKGNVYVSDDRTNKVVKLDAQTYKQTELPFGQLKQPGPLAVDDQGDVYVGDHGNQGITSSRIVKLPAR